MLGISGGEILIIIVVVLMLFGSDKIPEIARTLGRAMAQIKHATNEIKSEIHQSAVNNGLDTNTLTEGITGEIEKAKQEITDSLNVPKIENPIEKVKEELDNLTGPIKRQF